jgi:hypothetical protein
VNIRDILSVVANLKMRRVRHRSVRGCERALRVTGAAVGGTLAAHHRLRCRRRVRIRFAPKAAAVRVLCAQAVKRWLTSPTYHNHGSFVCTGQYCGRRSLTGLLYIQAYDVICLA